tara:strand:- start:3563 stop:3790 length:228 start_codon:yes stop_codon:yes gene_type:complete
MKKLNIKKLIDDMGGATKVAEIAGVQRTAPYGWIRQGHIRSTFLEKMTTAHPDIKIDQYFEERGEHDERKFGSST